MDNMNDVYYVVYSPETIRQNALDFNWPDYAIPDYMKKGYYLSPIAFEPWNIRFKGTLWQCINVVRAIDAFVYN